MKKKAPAKPKPEYPDITEPTHRERKPQDVVKQISEAAAADGTSMWSLMEGFVSEVGGPRDFVRGMAKAWTEAKDGSVAKQRMAQQIWGMLQTAHDEREQRKKSVSEFTTEELNNTIHTFLQQHGYAPPEEVQLLRSENERLKAELLKLTTQNAELSHQQQ